MTLHSRLFAGLALGLVLAACGQQSPPPAQPAAPEPAPAPAPAETAPPPVAAAPAPKVDPTDHAALKAGVERMIPRILATVDGYEKVAPRADFRFSLHPDMDKEPSIEFDISGLKQLTLSPYIADFSSNADCVGNPDAGVVSFRWTLDGGIPNEVAVDRTYAAAIDIPVGTAKRLKLEAEQANGVIWCDWFGVGIAKVE